MPNNQGSETPAEQGQDGPSDARRETSPTRPDLTVALPTRGFSGPVRPNTLDLPATIPVNTRARARAGQLVPVSQAPAVFADIMDIGVQHARSRSRSRSTIDLITSSSGSVVGSIPSSEDTASVSTPMSDETSHSETSWSESIATSQEDMSASTVDLSSVSLSPPGVHSDADLLDGQADGQGPVDYAVNRVHGLRRRNSRWEALTEWVGYPEMTWETTVPVEATATCVLFLLDAFHDIGGAEPRFVNAMRIIMDN